jgi:hypothetical protein
MKILQTVFLSIVVAQVTTAATSYTCACNAFPGNYPGIGLFLYPKADGVQAMRLRMFDTTNPPTQASVDIARESCRRVSEELRALEICD